MRRAGVMKHNIAAHTHIHTHTHTHTYIYTHIHTHICTHIHTQTHTDTYIHTHTHTYTHTHIHTYTGRQSMVGDMLVRLDDVSFDTCSMEAHIVSDIKSHFKAKIPAKLSNVWSLLNHLRPSLATTSTNFLLPFSGPSQAFVKSERDVQTLQGTKTFCSKKKHILMLSGRWVYSWVCYHCLEVTGPSQSLSVPKECSAMALYRSCLRMLARTHTLCYKATTDTHTSIDTHTARA